MFKKLINWWKSFTTYIPVKEIRDMTDQECIDEYTKAWTDFYIMGLDMRIRDDFRMCVLEEALKKRGYDIFGTSVSIKITKIK